MCRVKEENEMISSGDCLTPFQLVSFIREYSSLKTTQINLAAKYNRLRLLKEGLCRDYLKIKTLKTVLNASITAFILIFTDMLETVRVDERVRVDEPSEAELAWKNLLERTISDYKQQQMFNQEELYVQGKLYEQHQEDGIRYANIELQCIQHKMRYERKIAEFCVLLAPHL